MTDLERRRAALPEKELIAAVAKFVTQAQGVVRAAKTELEISDEKIAQIRREREQKNAALVRLVEKDVQAQVMSLSENLLYGAGSGYQAVKLPYVGGLSMIALVPEAGQLGAFERGLDGLSLRRIVSGLSAAQVILSMPRFSFRSQAQLRSTLRELGMPIAFTDRADFSGITKQASLQISDVVHQAFIAVDESGTEAAAATAVLMRPTSVPAKPLELRIDRPFMFLIQDDETGALLFLGRVSDPTA